MNDNTKSIRFPGLLNSFGDIPNWNMMHRPYIAVYFLDSSTVFYQEYGFRYMAKLYDGADYTGYHRVTRELPEIYKDIEENYPNMHQVPPGAEDDEQLICVYV